MRQSAGFTAVELMIALVVGALFLISGYQLYGVVNERSSAAREMAEASNVGYEVLRKEGAYDPTANKVCPAYDEASVSRTVTGLSNLNIKLRRCKPFSDSDIILTTVIVGYGNDSPQKEVVHATYVNS